MTSELYNMLNTSAEADRAKALLSLDLLGNQSKWYWRSFNRRFLQKC